jgi:hypothetical protein
MLSKEEIIKLGKVCDLATVPVRDVIREIASKSPGDNGVVSFVVRDEQNKIVGAINITVGDMAVPMLQAVEGLFGPGVETPMPEPPPPPMPPGVNPYAAADQAWDAAPKPPCKCPACIAEKIHFVLSGGGVDPTRN